MSIKILNPGVLTTVQDLGRMGFQKYGVVVGGAMDSYSLRLANLLVGNSEEEAVLEVTLFGTKIQFEKDMVIAITGGDLQATMDGKKAVMWRPIWVKKGSTLHFKSAKKGCRAYISFAGGLSISNIMGSKSTYLRAEIGGYKGRALQKGDVIECNKLGKAQQDLLKEIQHSGNHWMVNYHPLIHTEQTQQIRVIKGTEFDHLQAKSKEEFFHHPFKVTSNADRMGYRIEGPSLSLTAEVEMLSEGVTFGTIQLPPSGDPIILMADRQTTGGYPKISHVITADLCHLAQLQPMATIYFEEVSLLEAVQLMLEKEKMMDEIKVGLRLKRTKA
ncbi:antagonist of KipI [Oikeobacillus pervagus]|uniref:Antagonist of KipI n=1 Tax=Oikeobacillus pervagus TaxID=1325931 RepID=A0AAJ1T631_9BACI|nr:biotin-dependent carboxyltransferase family protein [Oikeobacillus pervagus]MDQ0215390.1 antagonist of KipI [Oikeobacillus pervagus]